VEGGDIRAESQEVKGARRTFVSDVLLMLSGERLGRCLADVVDVVMLCWDKEVEVG
jgi:hypothetical protein